MLLSSENVNQEALLCYAREAADFGTNYQLPTLDFAMNHYGQPDVAMFDFTSMHASENAALVRERFGHQLLVSLVGDSLLEVDTSFRQRPLFPQNSAKILFDFYVCDKHRNVHPPISPHFLLFSFSLLKRKSISRLDPLCLVLM